MNKDIKEAVSKCDQCIRYGRITHQPLQNSTLPEGPWQRIAADLMTFQGREYLVIVDYFSRWVEIATIERETAKEVVRRMEIIFLRTGFTCELMTDNGPCFKAEEFTRFCQQKSIRHLTSSPLYPESNGLVERMIQSIKRWWRKEEDFNSALLMYRSTPLESGASPAELFYGRKIRSNLPVVQSPVADFQEKDKGLKEAQKRNFDRRRKVKTLQELEPGDRVWTKTANNEEPKEATVVSKSGHPDSYIIQCEGRQLRRNRKHLLLRGAKDLRPKSPQDEAQEGYDLYRRDLAEESDTDLSENESMSEEERDHNPIGSGVEPAARDPRCAPGEGEGPEQGPTILQPSVTRSGRIVKKGHLRDDVNYY